MAKKPTDLTTTSDTDIEEGGSGESGIYEATYSKFAKEHGLDFSEMTVDEIREIIHQYVQEGKVSKGAKVYNLKGELISHKAKQTRGNRAGVRSYQVKQEKGKPVTQAEFDAIKAEQDYKASSEKQDKPAPDAPFVPPTPKGPGQP